MDIAQNIEPVKARPVDQEVIMAAGEPGTAPRLMVANALLLHARGVGYQHKGRGPDFYDWLGLVRQVIAETRRDFGIEGTLDDLTTYAASFEAGVPVEVADDLFVRWGLRRRICVDDAKPGDVLLFETPTAHAGVMTRAAEGKNPAVVLHTYWGRAAVQSWLRPYWADKLLAAYEMKTA